MSTLNPITAGKAGIQIISRNLVNCYFQFGTTEVGRFKARTSQDHQFRAERVYQQWLLPTAEGIYEGHIYRSGGNTNFATAGEPFIFGFLLPDDEYADGENHIYQIHISGTVAGEAAYSGEPTANNRYPIPVSPVLLMGASGVDDSARAAFTSNAGGLGENDNLDIHYMSNRSNSVFHGGVSSFDFRERWLEQVNNAGVYSGHKAIMLGIGERPFYISNQDGQPDNYTNYTIGHVEIRFSVWRFTQTAKFFNPEI